jgi:hypothetical protein
MEQQTMIVDGEMNTVEVANPLVAIVEKLELQRASQHDIVVPAGHLHYEGGILYAEEESFTVNELAHEQIASKLEIPIGYYRKMKSENSDLLAKNVNGWLSQKEKAKYLLRTFKYEGADDVCRAFLSNRYNILDNYDVLICALEAIKDSGIEIEIVKADITDKRMYLHAVAPSIHIDATNLLDGYLAQETIKASQLHNGIISGILLTNSEVGMGTFEVAACAQIVRCTNRMHDRASKFRKVHLGAKMDDGIVEWSTNTKNKNYDLIMSQVKDSVKTYLSHDYLGQLTQKLQKAKDTPIEHGIQVVENISNALNITTEHRQNVLKHFLRDQKESNVLGVLNAFTRETQKMDADTQYTVESELFTMLPGIHKFDKPLSKN